MASAGDADDEIERGELARANDQLLVERPMIQPDQEAGDADDPADGAQGRRAGAVVGDHRSGDEAEEAHMDGAHDLARHAAAEPEDEPEGAGNGEPGQGAVDDAAAAHGKPDQPGRPGHHGDAPEMREAQGRDEGLVEGNAEGGDDLEGGERDGDPEQEPAGEAFAEALRQAVLGIHGFGRRFHLSEFGRVHTLAHGAASPR